MDVSKLVWIDKGAPDCLGEVLIEPVTAGPNGEPGTYLHMTCPGCTLDWYNRTMV